MEQVATMSAKDRFSVPVNCPGCQNSGEAHLWQEDGYSWMNGDHRTHVTSLPEGFKAIENDDKSLDIICIKCGTVCG